MLFTETQLNDPVYGYPNGTEAEMTQTLQKLEQFFRDGQLDSKQVKQILQVQVEPFMTAHAEAAPANPTAAYTGAAGAVTRYYAAIWLYPLVPPPGNAGAYAGKFLNFLPGKMPGGRPNPIQMLSGIQSDQRANFFGANSLGQGAATATFGGTWLTNALAEFDINGETVTYEVEVTDTTNTILAASAANAINNDPTASELVKATSSGAVITVKSLSERGTGTEYSFSVSHTSAAGTLVASASMLTDGGPHAVASTAAALIPGTDYVTVTAPAYSGLLATGMQVGIVATDVNGNPIYFVGKCVPGGSVVDNGLVGYNAQSAQNDGYGWPAPEVCVGPTSGALFYGSTTTYREG